MGETVVYSFSRVNAYCTCPMMYKLTYIDKLPKLDNAFSQWGTLCHSLFERYCNGELELYELTDTYKSEYKQAVTQDFPESDFTDMNEYYYRKGIEVFDHYAGVEKGLDVVATEQKVLTEIAGKKFVGYIDLILRDKSDGKLIIQDYKSKSKFKSAKERNHYALQPFLYSHYIKEQYDEYPKLLRFDMFRVGDVVDIAFTEKGLQNADKWFADTIETIEKDAEFPAALDSEKDFFCKSICSMRAWCTAGKHSE